MKNSILRIATRLAVLAILVSSFAFAQPQHKWAGRTLDDLEQTIHERLAALPFHGVFDTVRFEVQGKTVILTGSVVKESTAAKTVRAVQQLDGVETVVNRVEVLPSSRRDDTIRKHVYSAIFHGTPGPDEGAYGGAAIHIIVKNGFVTLEGAVNSDTDRNHIYVKTVQVTPYVTNNLRIGVDQGQ